MKTSLERILLVENDPELVDFIVNQALQPSGYKVQQAGDVNTAIMEVIRSTPDLVIVDLNLPGLSGKDFLAAMASQGLQIPVIVIARKGEEQKVIQAFRLGAGDYLLWPVRETEVAASVERALKQVHDSHTRQSLDQQLIDTHDELHRRMRELTTLFALGKAVISITDQRVLLDRIIEGMVYVAEADYGWLLLREKSDQPFILAAHRNLPESWIARTNQQLGDISSLVAYSGETLEIHGEPLKRFKVGTLGKSALVVPVKIQNEVIGLLIVVRKTDKPFDKNVQGLVEAVTDYASISLVNARLFRAVQATADAAQAGEQNKRVQHQNMRKEIESLLQPMVDPLDSMISGKMGLIFPDQVEALQAVREAILKVIKTVAADSP